MLTTPTPATEPAKRTVPAPAAKTVSPPVAARSTPRWPGNHGSGGGLKVVTTVGCPANGQAKVAVRSSAAKPDRSASDVVELPIGR
jgi:hypothetical protein